MPRARIVLYLVLVNFFDLFINFLTFFIRILTLLRVTIPRRNLDSVAKTGPRLTCFQKLEALLRLKTRSTISFVGEKVLFLDFKSLEMGFFTLGSAIMSVLPSCNKSSVL